MVQYTDIEQVPDGESIPVPSLPDELEYQGSIDGKTWVRCDEEAFGGIRFPLFTYRYLRVRPRVGYELRKVSGD